MESDFGVHKRELRGWNSPEAEIQRSCGLSPKEETWAWASEWVARGREEGTGSQAPPGCLGDGRWEEDPEVQAGFIQHLRS